MVVSEKLILSLMAQLQFTMQVAAEAVASTLRGAASVRADGLLPLIASRSLEMLIGIFGILLAECAYVPLDPKWPADRVREVVAQCAPRAALVRDSHEAQDARGVRI